MSNFNRLNSITFTEIVRIQRLLEISEPVLDLSNFSFISPGGLVPLTALCFDLSNKGRTLKIKVANPNLRSYFVKSGFLDVVCEIVRFDPQILPTRLVEYDDWKGLNTKLIELTKIENHNNLDPILKRTINTLRGEMKYPKNDAFNLGIALSEMCQNTIDHNMEACGFFSLQLFNSGGGSFMEIGISDCGVGLAQTLRENPNTPAFKDDFEAIKLATMLGLSQYDDPTRGTGFYHLIKIVEKYLGSIRITSGSATFYYRADKNQTHSFNSLPMPGVTVVLSLPQI